jgi:hypothetical protein
VTNGGDADGVTGVIDAVKDARAAEPVLKDARAAEPALLVCPMVTERIVARPACGIPRKERAWQKFGRRKQRLKFPEARNSRDNFPVGSRTLGGGVRMGHARNPRRAGRYDAPIGARPRRAGAGSGLP